MKTKEQKILSNLNDENTGGSFTVANSNSFLSPCDILPIAKQIFREIFLFYHDNVCCVFSVESPR